MSIFGTIMNKIFHHGQAAQGAAPAATPNPAPAKPAATPSAPAATPAATPATASGSAATPPVDVEVVLTQMAASKGESLNWQTSIVDLLKLLNMDSSLDARKELAGELNIHVGADGTAEENLALHRAVMQKLAENGGKVPDNLKG